jgi:large subunit ribosomal protein L32
MAVPKRKTTPVRQGNRRSHLALKEKQLVECKQCHQPMLPHRACPVCGDYNGRTVLDLEGKAQRKAEKAQKAKAQQ